MRVGNPAVVMAIGAAPSGGSDGVGRSHGQALVRRYWYDGALVRVDRSDIFTSTQPFLRGSGGGRGDWISRAGNRRIASSRPKKTSPGRNGDGPWQVAANKHTGVTPVGRAIPDTPVCSFVLHPSTQLMRSTLRHLRGGQKRAKLLV